ncbi:MAG: hypothetical protein GY722_14695 [bacterium]|nr:hypothetical protein [bacterium]
MLAFELSMGPLVAGVASAALGTGLLLKTGTRRLGVSALVVSAVLAAISVVSAPTKYEGSLTSPEAQSATVVSGEDGYTVTVEIGECLTLYEVSGRDWRPVAFDRYPGDNWDREPEEFCEAVLYGEGPVNLPNQVGDGSWGLCSLSLCYVLENS